MLFRGGTVVLPGGTVNVGETLTIRLADYNENALPVGTTVEVTVTDGLEINGTDSVTVGNGSEASFFPTPITVEQDETNPASSGTLLVTVTTPKERVSAFSWPVVGP